MSECYSVINMLSLKHALIKGALLEIFKIRRSSNSKEVGEKSTTFFIDLFKAHFSYS